MVRGGISLSFAVHRDTTSLVVVFSIFLGVAATPWISRHIYSKKYLDYIEASFVLNFGILSAATHHLQNSQSDGKQAVLTYLFVSVAFVEFIGIIVFHLYLRISSIKLVQDYFKHAMLTQTTSSKATPKTGQVSTTTLLDLSEPLLEIPCDTHHNTP